MRFLLLTLYLAVSSMGYAHEDNHLIESYSAKIVNLKVQDKRHHTLSTFDIKLNSLDSEFEDLKSVKFKWYKRKTAIKDVNHQLTIVFPHLSPMTSLDKNLAVELIERGSDVLLMESSIHLFNFINKISNMDYLIRQQLIASHKALAFVLSESKYPQIQTLGFSLGGILSAALLATHNSVDSGIIFMGGAGFEGAKEIGVLAQIKRFFTGQKDTVSPGISFDASDYANSLKFKRSKIYRTKKDIFVPVERQDDMQLALGTTEVEWLRGQHVQNAFLISRYVDNFFNFFNKKE